MSAVDLHALPYGSVVADDLVVAIRHVDGPTPWTVTGSQDRYGVGHLLGMSQDWSVLRYGQHAAVTNLDEDKCPDCGGDPCIGFTCSGNEPDETRTEWENRMADLDSDMHGGPY